MGEVIELLHERTLKYASDQGGHVFEKYKFQATFREDLKLQRFPCDQQALAIRLTAERPFAQQQWSHLQSQAGQTKVPALWSVQRPQKLTIYDLKGMQTLHRCRGIVHLRRNPRFFLKHVVLVMFFLCMASALVLLVEPRNVGERSGILLTLLLVTAAYTHTNSQWVPRKPHYTWMDYYILLGFLLQLSVVCESLAMVQIYKKKCDTSIWAHKMAGPCYCLPRLHWAGESSKRNKPYA